MQLGCFSINNDPKYESRTAYQNLLKKISGNISMEAIASHGFIRHQT